MEKLAALSPLGKIVILMSSSQHPKTLDSESVIEWTMTREALSDGFI
jgi:hypothetical protein